MFCLKGFLCSFTAAATATLALRFRAKNICFPKRLIGRPHEIDRSERNSTPRCAENPYFIYYDTLHFLR